MHNILGNLLREHTVLIVDGGLATQLERQGADLNHELWSARMLIDQPDQIEDAHLAFLKAGADVLITASYQASLPGFEKAGLTENEAIECLFESTAVARKARERFTRDHLPADRLKPLIAASIGPYGACLADGSEYHGDYGLTKRALIDFHRPRMEILSRSGVDLFALETIPSQLEAEALLELLSEFPGMKAWLSFSCRNNTQVSHGESFAECVALALEHEQVESAGLNCTHPGFVNDLLRSVQVSSKPLIAYPNSGESWQTATKGWSGESRFPTNVQDWVRAGARLIGGCCRVGPESIRNLRSSNLESVAD